MKVKIVYLCTLIKVEFDYHVRATIFNSVYSTAIVV